MKITSNMVVILVGVVIVGAIVALAYEASSTSNRVGVTDDRKSVIDELETCRKEREQVVRESKISIQHRSGADGTDQLLRDQIPVFQGIGLALEQVSLARNGTMAVVSYRKHGKRIENADLSVDVVDGRLEGILADVWVIEPTGSPQKLNSETVHATKCVISGDGRFVAFKGEEIDAKGMRLPPVCYVVDLRSKKQTTIVSARDRDTRIAPIGWDSSGRILSVFTAKGETGKEAKIERFSIQETDEKS